LSCPNVCKSLRMSAVRHVCQSFCFNASSIQNTLRRSCLSYPSCLTSSGLWQKRLSSHAAIQKIEHDTRLPENNESMSMLSQNDVVSPNYGAFSTLHHVPATSNTRILQSKGTSLVCSSSHAAYMPRSSTMSRFLRPMLHLCV
jgi:hypothetical protein